MLVAPLMLTAANAPRLCVDFSASPDAALLNAFDVCMVRADAKVNLEATHALGSTCLAQINLFEIPVHSAAADYARELRVPLLLTDKNEIVRMDATHSGWPSVVIRELTKAAAARGFDGFVLTGADSISQDAARAACLRVIEALDAVYPDKQIVLSGGFDLVSEARLHLDGLLITGVERQWDAATKELLPLDAADQQRQEHWIKEGRRLGLKSYVVDFAAPGAVADIQNRAQRIQDLGGIPFFTTPALDGANLGPLRETTRRILVLHSGESRQSFTAAVLHGSLEWLGYHVVYRDINTPDDATIEPSVAGVIFDQTLQATPALQNRLNSLAARLAEQRVPLLLTGMPWSTAESFAVAAKTLNLRGTNAAIRPVTKPILGHADQRVLMDGAGPMQPRTQDFRDLRAPEGSQIWLSVRSQGRTPVTFDQVCITPWGGMWLDSLAPLAGPQVDPMLFLEQWLAGQEIAPVMDVSSQNGHRLLVSHISGAGFMDTSNMAGLALGGEAMLKEVLERCSLPVTVALCEGDVRGWTPAGEKRDALRYQETARAIFALSHVEAASESFSRPLHWASDHFVPGPLNPGVPDPRRSMEREIGGSLAYIHQELLPPNKSVALMLWPQDAVPGTAAVAFARKMGVENFQSMTGTLLPGRTAPTGPVCWGEGTALRTSMVSPRRGKILDAAAAIAEIQRTTEGNWMAPAQVALTFEDALNQDSLQQVKQLLEWCAAQPLRAITAGAYARIVRDAAQTRIMHRAAGHWIIVNEGHARTLRLPASAGVPDLKRSHGISGYTVRGSQLYVHTLGRRRTELVMQSSQPTLSHLHLIKSSAKVEFMEAGERRALLEVFDWRPVAMTFAGLQPGSLCMVNANGGAEYVFADNAGRIEFTVPSCSLVQLKMMPSNHAAMR
jgi:hypothetical protein